MPNRPKKKKRPWVPERKPFESIKKFSKKYNDHRWRELSKRFKEKNPYCVKCKEKGLIVASEVTDHIQRLREDGCEYDMYDETNLQALCKRCHAQKSGKEAHGYKERPNNS